MSILAYDALPGRVRFGVGAVRLIAEELAGLGAARVLLFDGLADPLVAQRVAADLDDRHAATMSVARQHVPASLAEAAATLGREIEADCLLALGGGSALGVAKALARDTGLPIVAVPTTYAGSEMTPIWGITEDGRKTTGRDLSVLPRIVVYDPELTVTLPPGATGASGMNAVAHCVEALWTARRTPVSDALACEGLRLLSHGLPRSVEAPGDLVARGLALRGAWLAGVALGQAGTALHHTICHVLGGAFDLPHAEVHAAVLPAVVEHLRPVAPEALRRIADALGADDAVQGLTALAVAVGATEGLEALGLDAPGVDAAASQVAERAGAAPAPVSAADVRQILEQAMPGPGSAACATPAGVARSHDNGGE
jgi:maleylacetate reductase